MKTRTTTTTVYTFDELSETAQGHAIERLWDINVDYDWWDFLTDDIARFGEVSGIGCQYGKQFDIDRAAYVHITGCSVTLSDLLTRAETVKGEFPNIYAEVLAPFLAQFTPKELRQLTRLERCDILTYIGGETSTERRGICAEIERYDTRTPRMTALLDTLDAAWREFLRDLEHAYLKMLRNEYEYATSREAIVETIHANEYDFDEDGNLV